MAKQTINIGSGELAGDGESPCQHLTKLMTTLMKYTQVAEPTRIQTQFLGGNLDPSGNDITGVGNLNIQVILQLQDLSASLAYSNLTSTPTTLAGYGITDAYTQTQVDTAITNATLHCNTKWFQH